MINDDISTAIAGSLREDIGNGDITAELLDSEQIVEAKLICRENAMLCGCLWVNEVYRQLDADLKIQWFVQEGQWMKENEVICKLSGRVRTLLTGERSALNWLQTLSGTATQVAEYLKYLQGSKTQLLDTRKTIPGLRYAQKYAVRIGGAKNHRMGLYDAYLIKENHIASCGSISEAVRRAQKKCENKLIEIEVESISQLKEALVTNVQMIMLDNFNLEQIKEAVKITNGRVPLDVSGNITLEILPKLIKCGVDYISVGALTKHVRAIDFSMRII